MGGNNEYLNNLLKKARSNCRQAQKLLYKEALYLIQPLIYKYSSYAKNLGISRNDLQDLMNDTFFRLLSEDIEFYDNFVSYYRRKYEFDVLRLFKTYRTKKSVVLKEALTTSYFINRNNDDALQVSSVEEAPDNEVFINEKKFFLEKLQEIEVIKEKELGILTYYLNGYSVKDIASIFKTSEYKIRHIISLTAKKIAKYNGLSEDVEYLSDNY